MTDAVLKLHARSSACYLHSVQHFPGGADIYLHSVQQAGLRTGRKPTEQ